MNASPSAIGLVPDDRAPQERGLQPCFGVGCPARGRCACYHAVERRADGSLAQGTCLREGGYPNYRPVAREVVRRHR
jgi:hypothetical protein